MSQQQSSNFLSEFSRFESEMNGSRGSALHALRKESLESVIREGIPTSAKEEWKYTNLSALSQGEFRFAARASVTREDLDALNIPVLGGPTVVMVNGFYEASLSTSLFPAGVTVKSLASVLKDEQEASARALFDIQARQYSQSGEVFPALNTAFASDGVLVHVSAHTDVQEPIHVIHLARVSEGEGRAVCPRHLIVVEEGAGITVVESFHVLGKTAPITIHLTQVDVAPNARCGHVKLQSESTESIHISYIDPVVARDARFSQLLCTLGGGLVRNEIRPLISGSGSECFLRGLTVIGGKQHVDNSTVIDHAVPHAQSTEIFKGVYGGEATSAFSGTIVVRKDAQKTNAIQSNDSILVSDRATINSRPQLKIWADDVKCTHGATVGQLRDDALHYLRARGIPRETARRMLIEAFSAEVVASIEHAALRGWVERELREKLITVLG